MSFRIEEKLYIKPENLTQFREFLSNLSVKKIYESRIIKSLYFDNLNFNMYNDSIEGSVPRKKIRIRHYPGTEDTNFYLEIKTSSIEGRFKTKKIINVNEYNDYKKNGILDKDYGVCLPNFYVKYQREYALIDDVRISIDKNISYENCVTNKQFFDNNSIVELKTSIDKNLDDLIQIFPFQKIRFSKYCFAVENLN
jgi:SPX domain protein involved in polyphosphate accumulation